MNDNLNNNQVVDLPPGFRFHPTDEEIISHYLIKKVLNSNFTATAIGEVDLNRCEPWDMQKKAKMGEKECYFFCQRDRKYPTGTRTNRATESGYWKATGKDKEIYSKSAVVGMKKTLVFYKGRAPKGEKLNWVMHEFRLQPNFSCCSPKDEWVVCRVIHRSTTVMKSSSSGSMNSFIQGLLDLPPLMDSPDHISAAAGTSLAQYHPISSDGKTIYYNQITNPYCKLEQFSSNQSTMLSRSQHTDDITTHDHISSSKQEDQNNITDIKDHSVISPLSDLDSFWRFS